MNISHVNVNIPLIPITHGSHICQFTYSLKFVTSKSYWQHIDGNLWMYATCWKIWVTQNARSQLRLNKAMLCLISTLILETGVLFEIYLVPQFSHFYAFCWWFHYLKWSPSRVLKSCVGFLNARRSCCALWRKYMC